jgi:HipA-like protein
MRKAKILFKDQLAGLLVQDDDGSFTFRYDETWFKNSSKPAISLSFPKTNQEFKSLIYFRFLSFITRKI